MEIPKDYLLANGSNEYYLFDAKRKAAESVYEMGYITKDEAIELVNKGCARRNDYTVIYEEVIGDFINFYCLEVGEDHKELLFDIYYNIFSVVITK